MGTNLEPGSFYTLPKNLHQAAKNVHELAVLCKLYQHANGTGECFPSIALLTQGLMSKMQVIRCLNSFEERGIITRTRTIGRVNHYVLHKDKVTELTHQSLVVTSHSQLPVTGSDHTSNCQLLPPVTGSDPNNNHINKNKKENHTTASKGESFFDFVEKLRLEYHDVTDFDGEVQKCQLWCEEHRKKWPSKLRLLNWLKKARDFKRNSPPVAAAPPHSRTGGRKELPDEDEIARDVEALQQGGGA